MDEQILISHEDRRQTSKLIEELEEKLKEYKIFVEQFSKSIGLNQ